MRPSLVRLNRYIRPDSKEYRECSPTPEIRRLLVTGAAGFIGSHTVEALLAADYQVLGLDNLSRGKMENLSKIRSHPSFDFVQADITETGTPEKVLKDVDAVIHLAAMTSTKQSIEDPISFHKTNATGTLQLLRAAVDMGVKRFVFASSAAVYGKRNRPPYDEEMPLYPESPYGASKVAGEAYCMAYRSAHGLETVILRYMNVFGPRARKDDYSGVMVKFATNLIQEQAPHIFGDGEQSRDFTYVGDIAKANLLAIQSNQAVGETLNIGTGKPTTVNQLAKEMAQPLKRSDIKPIHEPERPWEIKFSWAKIDKAQKLLGFNPETKLAQGLERFLEWYKGTLSASGKD
jgi:UDP-glucose 4-epimerase